MKRMPLREALRKENELVAAILKGNIFAYPTDTVYGLGCDATNEESVGLVRSIKRTSHPFSVIAPSKMWIRENMELKPSFKKHMDLLPGPYTLILKMKKICAAKNVSYSQNLGIRIPKHPLTKIIQKSGRPFVTTSCNISGKPTIRAINGLPKPIEGEVDYIIDGGMLDNPASKILDLTGNRVKNVR